MQMSLQTLHKAIKREAAAPGLNSPLNPVQLPLSRGKGSARIFSLWLEGGGVLERRGPAGAGAKGSPGAMVCAISPVAEHRRRTKGCSGSGDAAPAAKRGPRCHRR